MKNKIFNNKLSISFISLIFLFFSTFPVFSAEYNPMLRWGFVSTATNYTVLSRDTGVTVSSTASPRTLTLYSCNRSMYKGQPLKIFDFSGGAATNNITVDAYGSETIDGSLTKVISKNYGSFEIICNGSGAWNTIWDNSTPTGGTATNNTWSGANTYSEPIRYDTTATIVAGTTQTQSGATALTAEFNNVTTVGTAGDGVALPTAVTGLKIIVKNSGANILAIYPASSDSIDALAVNLPVRIQPGSLAVFYAKSAVVWESSIDSSFTLLAPSTAKGQLELKAADSAGNTVTTITNASQAGARTYTIPDAGANASFLMSESAQTVNGNKTLSGTTTITGNLNLNDVTTPAWDLTIKSDSTVPLSADRTLTIDMDDGDRNLQLSGNLVVGLAGGAINQDVSTTASPSFATVKSTATLGTAGANVTAVHYGDGMDITTVLTLANAIIGAPTAGANEAVGALIFTFPAGVHVQSVSYFNIGLTIGTVTTDTPDVGLGSVIASGNVAVLSGTATFEDYLTGQTWGVALDGSSQSAGPLGATAGILTGISLNKATDAKTLHLNVADGWNAGITGNLTASGTVTIKWTKM